MNITFYGAAGGVTGSKHLVETDDGKKILLDCGTFQGLSDMKSRNRSLPFEPDEIDAVVLSHAHIDHCGMLPLLVKRGFTGKIFATPGTKAVAEYMMADAAHIEFQDAQYRQRHHIGAPDEREPLFTKEDAAKAVTQFAEVPYQRNQENKSWTEILPGVELKTYDAGHIMGSAVSVLRFALADGSHKTLAYTGDVGTPGTPLLHDPEIPAEEIETVITESTYGNRIHKQLVDAVDRLVEKINEVYKRGGKIIIPAFSLGRTQAIVYTLHKLTDEGKIPRIPTYVDSPLATNLTDVYREHDHNYDDESAEDFKGPHDAPLDFTNLTYTRSTEESKALNKKEGPFIVISASGMMTAGRVVHHLRHNIADPKNAVLITGFQAYGTMGRRILEGAKQVKLYGDQFPVRAEIMTFNEFSAHADQPTMVAYLEKYQGLKNIILVHGEPKQADVFKDLLKGKNPKWEVFRPNEGDTIDV